MVSWKPCLIATAGYEYNCLVVHVTWYYTAYCIYVYTKAREDEFRELYRSYWRLAGLTDELWRTALVFTKSTSVKTGGQAPPLPNASYATDIGSYLHQLPCNMLYTKLQAFNKGQSEDFNISAPSTILIHTAVLNIV